MSPTLSAIRQNENGLPPDPVEYVMAHTNIRPTVMLLVGIALIASACASAAGDEPDTSDTSQPATTTVAPSDVEQPAVGALPTGPSALQDRVSDSYPDSLVDVGEIFSGGPPPDGIPPIDDPVFLPVAENIDLLPLQEAVVSLEINGEAKAYPVRAMVWHEIVNDTVGGVPVTVSYCPLCNSSATYERTIQGNVTTFGTSGLLFASALVMYDRATESLWTHFDGTAVVGLLAGTELVEHASPLLSWGDFVAAYPTGSVLDWEAAGFNRDYGRNPYSGYDTPDGRPFLFRGSLDDRAAAMQRVVGIDINDAPVAFALDAVSGGVAQQTTAQVGGADIVILWKQGQASALEGASQEDGRDVGSVGAFIPTVGDRFLTFTVVDDTFVDDQTGSVWTITGDAIAGELAGSALVPVPHLDTFWFAWSTYKPGTTLVSE